MQFWLRYDLRRPSFGAPTSSLAAVAVEQAAWADGRGFTAVQLPEHHGTADGYNPSPLMLGAAIAARTSEMRLAPVVILPLHDPVRIAEDLCVLDQLSQGRVELTVVLGYTPSEFDMFGVSLAERGMRADLGLQVLRDVFAGRPYEHEGRQGQVTPGTYSEGGPPIFVGGSVGATARRAARFGDGYYPQIASPEMLAEYEQACRQYGRPVGQVVTAPPPLYIHVSRDPERDWPRVAPFLMHETNSYARQAKALGQYSPFTEVETVEALRAQGAYLVLTPGECVDYLRGHQDKYHMVFPMLAGGLDPSLSWESLELLVNEVIPALQQDTPVNS